MDTDYFGPCTRPKEECGENKLIVGFCTYCTDLKGTYFNISQRPDRKGSKTPLSEYLLTIAARKS